MWCVCAVLCPSSGSVLLPLHPYRCRGRTPPGWILFPRYAMRTSSAMPNNSPQRFRMSSGSEIGVVGIRKAVGLSCLSQSRIMRCTSRRVMGSNPFWPPIDWRVSCMIKWNPTCNKRMDHCTRPYGPSWYRWTNILHPAHHRYGNNNIGCS